MRKKPTIIVLTRLTTRLQHRAYIRNVTKLRGQWEQSNAKLVVALNGPMNTADYARDLALAEFYGFEVWERDQANTCYDLPPFLYEVLQRALKCPEQYQHIGVLDDDAYFCYPEEAINTIEKGFADYPTLGQTGAMGGLRKSWRYEGHPMFVEYLKASPWTTLGCQVYRRAALEDLQDISWLNRLKFRADSLLALSMHTLGYKVGEQDLKFAHEMSTGLSGQVKDAAHHAKMLMYGANDWAVYREVLLSYYNLYAPTQAIPFDWYLRQVESVALAHRRTHTPHKKNTVTRKEK